MAVLRILVGVHLRAAVAALALAGCSLIADTSAPKRPWKTAPACTDYYVPPVVDSLIAAGLLGLVAAVFASPGEDEGGIVLIVGATALGLGSLTELSAVLGWRGVARCHGARGTFADELAAGARVPSP